MGRGFYRGQTELVFAENFERSGASGLDLRGQTPVIFHALMQNFKKKICIRECLAVHWLCDN
jgi:hypothetical protein